MTIIKKQVIFIQVSAPFAHFWLTLFEDAHSNLLVMSTTVHRIFVLSMAGIVLFSIIFFSYHGYSYYSTSMEERFYHPSHDYFKPSGLFGHGLGIVGTFLILFGVTIYIARKRMKALSSLGRLKHWLEFHIFLCSLGPVMILFHTAFRFGGIVSIAFWSMVAVVLSGVIGRFIYNQIPRTIEGRALSLNEVQQLQVNLSEFLINNYQLDAGSVDAIVHSAQNQEGNTASNLIGDIFQTFFANRRTLAGIRQQLRKHQLPRQDVRKVVTLVKNEMTLQNRIRRLQNMQQLFKYWHVAHLPFALIMLIIVLIHVGLTLAFGYTWIF